MTRCDIENLPRTFFDLSGKSLSADKSANHSIPAVYATSHTAAFFLLFYHRGMQLSVDNVIGFFAFAILFLLPFGILSTFVLAPLEQRLYRMLSPNFKNWCNYQSALAAYSASKQKYDEKVRERDREMARQQEDYWRSLSGVAFEGELGKLFLRMGYDVKLTSHTNDGGVDLILRKDGKLTIVQCKAHNKRVSIGTIRELCTSLTDFGADDAIVACFEGVTKPVHAYIKGKPISVLDLKDIVALQRQHAL